LYVLAGETMQEKIATAKADGDSVGGIIECAVTGLPIGLGDPMFDSMESRISQIVYGIPAVKGVEFGAGFQVAQMQGSENNDDYAISDGEVITTTNHCGGILGGITNGMPLLFRAAVKPTPSIYKTQQSISINRMEEVPLQIQGRHDPCIVPRAVPVVEAAAAIAIYDLILGNTQTGRRK
jgi:chorismate synthase